MTDATAALALSDAVPAAAAAAASSSGAVAVAAAAPSTLRVQLSQMLGLTVSVGSALVKIPQLLALLRSRSTAGVSLSMYTLEIFSQSIAVFYHRAHSFPVATYGENLSLGAGNVAILAAFAAIDKDPRAVASLLLPVLLSPLVRSPSLLALLQSLSIPINIAAKVPQMRINQQLISLLRAHKARLLRARWAQRQQVVHSASGSPNAVPTAAVGASSSAIAPASIPTSSLSPVPFALNLAGSISRLFTTVTQLQGDRVMLLGFAVSIALNGIVLVQCHAIAKLQRECREIADDSAHTHMASHPIAVAEQRKDQ